MSFRNAFIPIVAWLLAVSPVYAKKPAPETVAAAPLVFSAKYKLSTVSGFVIGVRIDDVIPDSPEARVGFESRDIVLSVDNVPLSSVAKLQEFMRTVLKSSKKHTAVIRRNGFQSPVTLPPKPVKAPKKR